jgi:hypothetical protein
MKESRIFFLLQNFKVQVKIFRQKCGHICLNNYRHRKNINTIKLEKTVFFYVTGSVGSDAEPEGHKRKTDAQTSSQAKPAHFNGSSVGGFCLSGCYLNL